jgi:hypothetical protein
VIAHSLPLEPAAGAVSVPDLVLECGGGQPALRIAGERTYCITARDEAACTRLTQEALRCPAAELLPGTGGLLVGLSVLENMLLPALYHGRVAGAQLAERVYQVLESCGVAREEADALSRRRIVSLDGYERRLVALARSLLMRPPVLLAERIFEGLTLGDMERVARFGDYYRGAVPGGALVWFNLAGMPCPDLAAAVRAEAE